MQIFYFPGISDDLDMTVDTPEGHSALPPKSENFSKMTSSSLKATKVGKILSSKTPLWPRSDVLDGPKDRDGRTKHAETQGIICFPQVLAEFRLRPMLPFSFSYLRSRMWHFQTALYAAFPPATLVQIKRHNLHKVHVQVLQFCWHLLYVAMRTVIATQHFREFKRTLCR